MNRIRPKTINNEPSRTQQHQASEVDIKSIMKRAQSSRTVPAPSNKLVYGDFTNVYTYQQALDKVVSANRAFMTLPSRIRERFQNDPSQLISFLSDKKNLNEAVELGILDKPQITQSDSQSDTKDKT